MRRSLARNRSFFCGIMTFVLLAVRLWAAAERPSLFDDANRLYEQGKYAEAISHYESLAEAGHNSAAVFFNLGNAHFKQGNLGRALFNYRKAEALAPRDPDIQANLRFTRERVRGNISLRGGPLRRLFRYFTLNELASFGGVLLWLWAGIFCAIRIRPHLRPALRTPQLLSGLALAIALFLLAAAAFVQRAPSVIVTARQATVHLGPLPESQPAFVATDGAELRLLESRREWMQVSDRSGRTGWISARDAAVFP